MKAVIPAAGLGTRMLPATKSSPKEMLPVVDKPAIQYVVEECVASGIRDILIITGRGKRAIEDHFDRSVELESLLEQKGDTERLAEMRHIAEMANLHYVRQREIRGLGHAVLCARPFVGDEPFALLLGDDLVRSDTPCTRQLMDVHARRGGSVLAVERLPRARLSAYGVVAPGRTVEERLMEVHDLVEKPTPEEAPSEYGIMGRYVLSPAIFDALEATGPGFNGEIQLTDALRKVLRGEPVWGYHFDGQRLDVGTRLEWLKTNIDLALERADLAAPLKAYLEDRLARK
ncbi:MAG TPA: UTP--glucose-1-phosphate uridylyltransferase GalU [Candidatus Thermoplasmatota archaeon]|nr:UTP--glucose-1-phosphate uridylyltransferase GalU [Candidatus Thermoplasmatota archaeon]